MSTGAVAKRYAKALFEAAKEKQIITEVERELHDVLAALADNPEFRKFLHHPQIPKEVKKEQFNTIFSEKVSETMIRFMDLLIERDREDALDGIAVLYTKFANAERGLEDAVVTSTKAITDDEKTVLATKFKQLLNKDIRIHNIVDPTILGGMIVKIGDRIYDGSVSGKLHRFKRRVITSKS